MADNVLSSVLPLLIAVLWVLELETGHVSAALSVGQATDRGLISVLFFAFFQDVINISMRCQLLLSHETSDPVVLADRIFMFEGHVALVEHVSHLLAPSLGLLLQVLERLQSLGRLQMV